MPTLQIQLLGSFHLIYNGEPVPALNQVRLQSLLAYLFLHPNTVYMRQHLVNLFWPQASAQIAHINLDQLYQEFSSFDPWSASGTGSRCRRISTG